MLILTGPPGAGKTTVARLLAEGASRATVHLHTDDFYTAIRTGFVTPWLPEANDQNRTVSTAIAAAAGAYAGGGFDVIIDGIVGPWFLDLYRDEAGRRNLALSYVVLRPDKADAVGRAAGREAAPLADYPLSVFEAFADLGPIEAHVIDLGTRDIDETLEAVRRGLADGAFAVGS
jgi:predicted kinase